MKVASKRENLAPELYRNQNKDSSISAETHINHDQIHHIRSDWLGSIFFFPGVTQKVCLYCFVRVLNVSLRLMLIQNGSLYPLRLHSLITEFSVLMLFQDITSGNS